MKNFTLILLLCLCTPGLTAQTDGRVVTRLDQTITFTAPDVMDNTNRFGLGSGHQLRKKYVQASLNDRTHVKYEQFYRGLRVLAGTVVFHLEDDQLYATTGRLGEFDNLDVKGRISERQGEQLARLRMIADLGPAYTRTLELTATKRAVANTNFPEPGGNYTPVVVYTLKDEANKIPVSKDVVVDANTGRIIASLDNIHTDATTGHGDGVYQQDLTFPVDSISPWHYELRDLSRGQGIFAYDISDHDLTPRDSDNEWVYEEEGRAGMIDGYTGSVLFYDFMQDRFDRNSIDDQGHPLVANMNRHDYVNAFWNGSETTYGNGNCENYSPLTVYEIVGHEYAHGLTQFTSGLIYYNESGAMNEAISDIIGKAFEWDYDNEHFEWKIGSQIRKSSDARFFRSMENPWQRSHPKYYKGRHWRFDEGDNAGVHSKSGIMNFWFYLMVEGKRAFNEGNELYDVEPIGLDSALQLVYLLETAYLTENSNFAEAYQYTKMAATDLWGEGSFGYDMAIEAWKAVGLTDETVPEDQINVSLTAVVTSSGGFDSDVCRNDLENLSVNYYNFGRGPVPENHTVEGYLVYNYVTDTSQLADTILFESRELPIGLDRGDVISFPAPFNPTEEFLSVSASHNVFIRNQDGDTVKVVSVSTPLSFDEQTEVELTRERISFGNVCAIDPQINSSSFSFSLPRCFTDDEGRLRFVFTGPAGVETYEEGFIAGDPSIFVTDVSNEVDIEAIGDLIDARLDVYATVNGTDTLLHKVEFIDRFAETMDGSETEDFTNEGSARRRLATTGCASCTTTYDTEQLILHDSSQFYNQEECIPIRDFFNNAIDANDDRISTISVCIDGGDIDDPYLTFDLRQEDNTRYTRRQNEFSHIVDVFYDGRSLMAEPISTTGREMTTREVRLGDGFEGVVEIHVVSSQVNTVIDNIGVVSGSPSSVRGPDQGRYDFAYANPAREMLALTANETLPAGTVVSLINTAGQVLRRTNMNARTETIALGSTPAGLYFLTVSDGRTFSWTGRVVVQ